MDTWREDLFGLLLNANTTAETAFSAICEYSGQLGFEYVSYGFQMPYPITRPRIFLINNYPRSWQEHYEKRGYLLTDPTVIHGRQNQDPMVWNDQTFAENIVLWEDAQDHGIRSGWAQSCLDINGAGGMLCLCRSSGPLPAKELKSKEMQMRWLVQVAHLNLSRRIIAQEVHDFWPSLTSREREVLQWTADGKSALDIADILNLSKGAIDFHLGNCLRKLQSPNKTAAVARAIVMGLIR